MSDPISLVQLRQAIQHVRRHGLDHVLAALEQQDPLLAGHLMDELAALHHDLLHQGIPPKRLQQAHDRLKTLCLVLLTASRRS